MIAKAIRCTLTIALALGSACAVSAQVADAPAAPPRAAIFVQNRAGADFQDKLDVLNDLVTARLTEKGFSIIARTVVVAKFRESKISDDVVVQAAKTLTDLIKTGKTEAPIENVITDASALRISQMIGADFLVFAAITSAGQEKRTFKGQGTVVGTDTEVIIHTLRIVLKVLEGNQGGSVYGDVVTVSEKVPVLQNLATAAGDIVHKLLDDGAVKIAENIAAQVPRLRSAAAKSFPPVEFSIMSNIEGATVELDGVVIGTAPGRFRASPGIHQLRITREHFATWEKTINIFPDQVLTVSLELSEEGGRRYRDIETFKQALARQKQDMELEKQEREAAVSIAVEQSAASAEATRKIAEGEKQKRQQSYIRDDGIGNEVKELINGGK